LKRLNAFNDNPVARLQPIRDQPLVADFTFDVNMRI
jgi:hypothetical protein